MKFPRLKLNLDQISIIPIDVEIWFKKKKKNQNKLIIESVVKGGDIMCE